MTSAEEVMRNDGFRAGGSPGLTAAVKSRRSFAATSCRDAKGGLRATACRDARACWHMKDDSGGKDSWGVMACSGEKADSAVTDGSGGMDDWGTTPLAPH